MGIPSRGIHAKTRRDSIPLSPRIVDAIGFVPRKSNSSQPSSPASASVRCTVGKVAGVSIEFGKVVLWRLAPVPATGGRVQSNSGDAISALEIFLLALLGVVVGTYGTLVGVGGGFLVVPLLLIIYKLPPAAAAATSLLVVLLNSVSGSVAYVRRGRVDIRTGLLLAAATLPGACFIVPGLAERIPERAFKIGFGLFLMMMAALLFFRPERRAPASGAAPRKGLWRVRRSFRDGAGATVDYEFDVVLAVVLSFVVGILSSMLGIGGGIVHVPALIHLMGFPVHVATATSQFVLAFTAAAGVANYSSGGHVLWPLAAVVGAGVIVGAQVGARLSQRMKGTRII